MSGSIGQTSSGSVFIGGTSSKLNTAALIDAAVKQKTIRADRLQVEIDNNVAKIGAYDELTRLTDAIDKSLQSLKGLENSFDDSQRVWDLKSGTVNTSDGSNYASILDVAIDSKAATGSYQIEVLSVAKAHKVHGNSVADKDAALGHTGTFDLALTGGGSATISVSATDSLQDIANSINAQKGTTGVEASVLKVGENEFQLVVTGTENAKDIVVSGETGDNVLNLIGVTDGVGGFQNELQASSGAQISLDGVVISRNDNNFDDVVTGVDLDLKSAAPGTKITLEIGNDTAAAKEGIKEFVKAYNAFRDFVVKNQQIDSSGKVAEGSKLFGDNILSGLADKYSDLISRNFGNGGDIQTIRDLGITIVNQNKLEITDEARLDNALLQNFEAVKNAFASSSVSDNAQFRMTENKSVSGSMSIAFNLTTDGAGTITGVTANGDGAAFTISGNSIVGATGTAYEGMRFTYVGTDANVTINVGLTQGLADKVIDGANGYTDKVSGLVIREKATLQVENKEKTEDAKEIVSRAEKFRAAQIEKYSKLESDLARLNTLLDQIRAILGNTDDDR